ncbi:MAG: hypothetical protein DRJ56_07025 [Thermoprotei archaeon]|nr:MAG: hypothetical protein DRJ56_07025 [Thermoprotei archaeon]
MTYTLLFVLTFFALTAVTVLLDEVQHRIGRKYYMKMVEEFRAFLYVHVFKLLAEVALLWLIVTFIGQMWMGWIKF